MAEEAGRDETRAAPSFVIGLPMQKNILVVDDDPDIVLMLTDRLESLGYATLSAGDGQRALELLESEEPGLVLLDLEMPRMTAHGTIERAVEAMKRGAFDFLTKPLDVDQLTLVMQKVLEREALKRHVAVLREEIESRYGTIVADTPAMASLIELIKRAADSDATVLLLGESGTGKELFARSVHQWSRRIENPFVVINCVALTETLLENELFGHEKGAFTGATTQQKGKVELADDGTLFLDEIGDMAPDLQAKLLRLLQDREFHRVGGTRLVRVNIRVIAATNRDLSKAVKEGTFREDLFHRLNVISFSIPPLRDRPGEIPHLADLFLRRYTKEMGKPGMRLTEAALGAMQQYPWPGNVRELENAVARAVVLCTDREIGPEHLRLAAGQEEEPQVREASDLSYHEAMEHYRYFLIEQALKRAHGNQTKAAEALGLQRSYLARVLKQKRAEAQKDDR